jgi:hypothetical protein
MLQIMQRKQGATYLADQTIGEVVAVLISIFYQYVWEFKLENMAGLIAAPNTSPPAAVQLVTISLP